MTQPSRRAAALGEVRAILFDNWPYKAITLCFAVLTWAWVQSEQVVEERVRVRLEWTMPDGLVAVETRLETATVTVAGVQALMRNIGPGDLVMPIDLSGASEGDATIDLAERAIQGLPTELRVVSIAPSTLRVQLDRVLKRRLKVAAVVKGEAADGFAVREIDLSPDHVELSGPASLLRPMTELQTEEIDVTGLREDADLEVSLALSKSSPIRVLKPGPLTASVKIASTVRERLFPDVPVVVRGDRYQTTTTLQNVTIEGPEALVGALRADALSVIVYAPDDFAAPEGDAHLGTADAAGLRFEVLGVTAPLRVSQVEPETLHLIQRVAP